MKKNLIKTPQFTKKQSPGGTSLQAIFHLFDYLCHRQISWMEKIFVFGAWLIYVISPIDFLPDFVPVIGWLDDVGVSLLVIAFINHRINKVDKAQYSLSKNTEAEVVDVELLNSEINSTSQENDSVNARSENQEFDIEFPTKDR
jgi:uncharacterized membrane protein YkvA (DUF1232 family)